PLASNANNGLPWLGARLSHCRSVHVDGLVYGSARRPGGSCCQRDGLETHPARTSGRWGRTFGWPDNSPRLASPLRHRNSRRQERSDWGNSFARDRARNNGRKPNHDLSEHVIIGGDRNNAQESYWLSSRG